MKFGKTFASHQVPEWSAYYMNYKELKKQIKFIVHLQEDFKREHSADDLNETLNDERIQEALAHFFSKLDKSVEKIDSFYNNKFSEYEKHLRKISTAIGGNLTKEITFDQEDLEEIINILIELRGNLRNLKWFGELNKRGFIKILKKLDKKTGINKQMFYLSARVFPTSFANQQEILRLLNSINGYLSDLAPRANELNSITRVNNNNDNSVSLDSYSNNSAGSTGYVTPTTTNFAQYIKEDDGAGLIKQVINEFKSPVLAPPKLLINLLNKSAVAQSFDCIDKLLHYNQFLSDTTDISSRNFFHHHVISLGKQVQRSKEKAAKIASKSSKDLNGEFNGLKIERDGSLLPAAAPETNHRLVGAYGSDGINSNDSPNSLEYILEKLPEPLKSGLSQRDNYNRTPLHYAAQYGLKDTAKILITYLKKWGQWNNDISIDDTSIWGDTEYLTPLHLALVGNHPKTVKILLESMNKDVPLRNPSLLLLATRLRSPKILDCLLNCKGIDINFYKKENRETALYIATKHNYLECIEFLLQHGADPEISESLFGWTPIFVAAAEGFDNAVKLLLKYKAEFSIIDESGWLPMEHASLRGHLSLAELLRPKDYDPLKLAKSANLNNLYKKNYSTGSVSSEGSNNSVYNGSENNIPEAKESKDRLDRPTILELESTSSIDKLPNGVQMKQDKDELYREIKKASIVEHESNVADNGTQKPVKSFGHQFLSSNEYLVLLTLGTTDIRDKSPAIQLNRVPISKAYSTELDTALSVSISCKQLNKEPPVVLDLPLDDVHGSATDPISFKFVDKDPFDATIYFDIVPTYSYNDQYGKVEIAKENLEKKKVLGRGVLLLKNAYTNVGPHRRSLYNVITVPIIEADTLEDLGWVRFEIMTVSSFTHPKMVYDINESYWKTLITTRVIGHRGLGKNFDTKSSLQLGENTMESFIAAASLGASYVEFDVQLTKDHVPVIYHDFLVAESGVDIPMHQLTAEQFLKLSEHRPDQEFHNGNSNNLRGKYFDDDVLIKNRKIRGRASSLFGDATSVSGHHLSKSGKNDNTSSEEITNKNSTLSQTNSTVPGATSPMSSTSTSSSNYFTEHDESEATSVFDERMKLTRTYKEKKFKGNSRGSSIASSFVTLEDLFKKLPENVGFNIECKYPMLQEAQKEEFEEISVDLNFWVNVVLKTVYELKNDRNIIFSSFHPDICIMLTLKQPAIPVLFLTEGGSQFMADARSISLQAAIRFAKKWNLLGIVSAADPIVQCPRLARVVKSNGLVCFTYGVLNNDPKNAKLEVEAGVDAVIVDKVLAVRKGLTAS